MFFTEGNGDVLFNDPDFFDWFGENIMLEGSNTEEGTEVPLLTELSIEIPNTGTHRFWWTVEGIDLFEEDDIAFYTVNDEVFIFEFDFGGASTRGFGFGGYVEIDLNAGDAFSFGIETLTNCCMTPRLIIYGFSWPVDCTGGCFDDSAFNYNPDADYDNEWCTYLNECDEEISAGGNLVGFTNEFSADNWSVLSMGDGYVDINNETLFIFGSDSDEGNDILTQATIVAPISGTYTFNWLYFTIDGSFYDVAYYINDQVMELTEIQDEFGFWFGNSGQSGTVSIEVVEGDVIGFGINAIDDCCGYATLTISQFTYPVTTVCAPGCTDEDACNYNPEANFDDGNCDYTCYGCTDDTALNYDPEATIEDGSCVDECEFPEIDLTAEVCANGVFNIEMTVSNLGNTPPYVVTNNVDASVLTISETGSYMYGPFSEEDEIELTVTSVVAPDCNFTFETIACETTVLELNALAFGLFPNPASDQVIIRSASDRQVEVILFDMAGKIVFNTSLMTHATGSAIAVGHLAAGTYIVQLRSSEGVANERLVIQR